MQAAVRLIAASHLHSQASTPSSIEMGIPVCAEGTPRRAVLSVLAETWNGWMAERGYPAYSR